MSYVRSGVRYRRVRSRGSRWGGPKVHLEFWDRLNKAWLLYCTRQAVGYKLVDDDVPVQCVLCLESGGAK